MYTYPCVGGPLAGKTAMSRFADGFILVDKPAQLVWIYDAVHAIDRTEWVMRAGSPSVYDREHARNAANETYYDVRAYDNEAVS